MSALSHGLRGITWFFQWWLGELASLVPGAVRQFFRTLPDTVVLDLSGGGARVVRCGASDCREIGHAQTDNAEDIRGLLSAAGAGRCRTALRIDGTNALTRTLSLPAAASDELRNVLSHQIEHLTPFQAADAYFGYRGLGGANSSGLIDVELTVVPRRFVDPVIERARAVGMDPEIVDVAGGAPLAAPEINLIAGTKPARANPWPRINALLAVAALGLGLAAVLIPLDRAREAADRQIAEVAKLRRASQQVLELRQTRDTLVARARFIAAQKAEAPSSLRVLDELTRIIPKDSWLYEIRINRPEVRISGYSPSAAALIGRINDSPLFKNPRFRSPVTRPSNIDKERFNLSFELAPAPEAPPGTGAQ